MSDSLCERSSARLKLFPLCHDRQLYSAEPVWEEPEDLRTMLDESSFEVTEEMVRYHAG